MQMYKNSFYSPNFNFDSAFRGYGTQRSGASCQLGIGKPKLSIYN